MTKEEIKAYISDYGNAEDVLDAIRSLKADGVEITKEALDERLGKTEVVEEEILPFEEPEEQEEPAISDPPRVTAPKRPSKLSTPILVASILSPVAALVGAFFSEFTRAGSGMYVMSAMNPMCCIGIAIMVAVEILALSRLFDKAGQSQLAALIPICNLWVLCKVAFGKGSSMFGLLIPFYNFYWMIKLCVKLAKVFGKGGGFAAGLFFFPTVFLTVLAFGDSRYRP